MGFVMTGYIYVLKAENGHIKFGFTKTPDRRISGLKSSNGGAIEVLHIIPGTLAQERHIHNTLKPHAVRGEWYHDTDEVRAFIGLVSRNELPDIEHWRAGERELSQDIRDCMRAAQTIVACGSVFGLCGHKEIAKHFNLPLRPLFKFLYRPCEPMMGEYLALMHGCVVAGAAAKKHLDETTAFASEILADHEAGLKRVAEASARLAVLEAELAA
jgi:hypothetical protein